MIARSIFTRMCGLASNRMIFRSVSFKDRLANRSFEKQREQFTKEMNFLANKSDYSLQDYKQRTIDGIQQSKKGILSKFMSGNDQTEAHLHHQLKILNAMFEKELQDPNLISRTPRVISQGKIRHRDCSGMRPE